MGRAARERVLRSFAFEQQVSNTEKMYLDLCGAVNAQQQMPMRSNALIPGDASPAAPMPLECRK
jgi:hypothetical protein